MYINGTVEEITALVKALQGQCNESNEDWEERMNRPVERAMLHTLWNERKANNLVEEDN